MSSDYEVDTVSDGNLWVVLRRVHFFANDQTTRDLDEVGVGVTERRLLDALDYGETCGHRSLSIGTLCLVVQAPLKPSTAVSTLQRMEGRDWVAPAAGDGVGPRWALTEDGREVRIRYKRLAEQVQERIYAEADRSLHHHLERLGQRAITFMNDRVVPVLDAIEAVDGPRESRTIWGGLRRIHFYLSDLITYETASMGVGMNDRRVLDALSYARKHGVVGGLGVASICRLNVALNRQTALSTLDKAAERGWVRKTKPTAPRGWLWDLTDKGNMIRKTYKRYAQHKLREAYELGEDDEKRFLQIALSAQNYRDACLSPAITKLIASRSDAA